jgi:hypothetical protein
MGGASPSGNRLIFAVISGKVIYGHLDGQALIHISEIFLG